MKALLLMVASGLLLLAACGKDGYKTTCTTKDNVTVCITERLTK